MSRRRKAKQDREPARPPSGKRGTQVAGVALLAAAIVVGLGFGWWKFSRSDAPGAPGPAPAAQAQRANPPAPATDAKADYRKLEGKWLRPDGGYVIDIKSVDASGAMDASYSNPRPIHVAKAQASQDGATTKVFIELRDVNYPGSTYTLAYDPPSDRLFGIYYQAVQQQRFEVVFERMK